MPNIRVDVNFQIQDGTEIVFRSPCDCSEITGLIVYANGEPYEFALADAHGNNVGDIDHLFAEDVLVKVILHMASRMAYVQNADTNAYIERTFIKTINGVGPDENGNVAAAQQPLEVVFKYDNTCTHTSEEILDYWELCKGEIRAKDYQGELYEFSGTEFTSELLVYFKRIDVTASQVMLTTVIVNSAGKVTFERTIYAASGGGVVTDEQIASAVESYMTLGVHTDGLLYLFYNGKPVGSGVQISGSVVVGGDTVELSDGITLTTLMFSDDFEGDSLGSTWKSTYGHDNAALSNWWTAKEENLGVKDSCLRLTMLRNNPNSEYEISGAKVETMQHEAADNYGFDTGYCEVKFKLDKVGAGIWPAIWCVGQTQTDSYSNITDESVTRKIHGRTWPWAGEIDQMDAMGATFSPGLIFQTDPYVSTIQTDRSEGISEGVEKQTLEADTWYTIGVLKTKEQIKVYFNRILVGTFDITDNECFSSMGEKLIINLSTGSFAGTLPEDVNEVNMYVDYVKVYSLSDSYVTLAEQNTSTLLPDYADGFACVAGRKFLLYPQFAENTQNTALYWRSSNTSVATVVNGYVSTIANGECSISATDADGNDVINFALIVKDGAGVLATSMVVTSTISAIAAGETADVTANIYPVNCDSLTPTLTVISGSDYCAVDGVTIQNVNRSGESQTVVVRVGTNNETIYEDLTIIMDKGSSYDVTPTDNLMCNYNVSTMSGGKIDSVKFYWDDALGNGKQIYFANGNLNLKFDGICATSSNSLWYTDKTVILDNLPESFTALMLLSVASGNASAFSNGDTMNQYGAQAERINQTGTRVSFYKNTSDAKYVSMNNVLSQKVVVGETFSAAAEVSAVCVTSDGTLHKTEAVASLYESTTAMGNLRIFGGKLTNGGFVGNFYQMLIFDRVLSNEEIVSFANQMFENNPN